MNSPFEEGYAYRIDSLCLTMGLDAAGAILMNGIGVHLDLYFTKSNDGTQYFPILEDFVCFVGLTGLPYYTVSLAGTSNRNAATTVFGPVSPINWDGRVPKEIRFDPLASVAPFKTGLVAKFFREDGGNFPVNTVFYVYQSGRQSTNGIVPGA